MNSPTYKLIANLKKTKRLVPLIFSFIVFFTCENVVAQSIDYSRLVDHPRLLMTKSDEKSVHEIVNGSIEMKRVYDYIMQYSDELITTPTLYFKKSGKRLLDVSREAFKRIFYTAFAYRMTGEEKYLVRAIQEIRAVCSFVSWNPTHFLDTAEMTLAVAIGYDWLYNELDSNMKDMVRKAIVEKGFLPSKNSQYNWFLNEENNWNQVCNTGMVYGALALMENHSSPYKEYIERALATIRKSIKNYGPDGNYPEGYCYWGYGTSFNVFLIAALESALGTDAGLCSVEGFMESARYMLYMAGTTGLAFNFSDSRETRQAFPAQFWFAAHLHDSSLLWNEKQYLSVDKPYFSAEEARFLPISLIYGAQIDMNDLHRPTSKIWYGRGVTPVMLIRTDWDYGKGCYVGIKGGKASTSHAHMDAGSFVFESDGVRWAKDFGMQEYITLESKHVDLWDASQDGQRWDVFRYNNEVHNTLTVNGKRHNVDGFVPITRIIDKDKTKGAVLNLEQLFSGDLKKAERTILLIDDQYLQVTDKLLSSKKDNNVRWTLLTGCLPTKINDKTVHLTKEGKKLEIVIESPSDAKFQILGTKSTHSYDASNEGNYRLVFDSYVPKLKSKTLKVLLKPLK